MERVQIQPLVSWGQIPVPLAAVVSICLSGKGFINPQEFSALCWISQMYPGCEQGEGQSHVLVDRQRALV